MIELEQFTYLVKPLKERWKQLHPEKMRAFYGMTKFCDADDIRRMVTRLICDRIHEPTLGQIRETVQPLLNEARAKYFDSAECSYCGDEYMLVWEKTTGMAYAFACPRCGFGKKNAGTWNNALAKQYSQEPLATVDAFDVGF